MPCIFYVSQAKNLDRKDPVKESMKTKIIQNMNEAAQTDLDKGVADCVPEAPVCRKETSLSIVAVGNIQRT